MKNSHRLVLMTINPDKDVDDLTEQDVYDGATSKGVLSIIDSLGINVKEQTGVIIGSAGMVGRELA